MKKTSTIKDVAAEANVSIATVSRVINRSTNVTPELEARVLAAAQKVNYTPNNVARSLKKSHTASIGFLVSNISDPFFISIAKGIEDYIQEYGYNLIMCSIGYSQKRESSYLQMLNENKVEGLIVNTSGYNDDLISALSNHIPIVLSNRKILSEDFVGDFVDSENVGCAYELTKKLLINGHKKIGIINGLPHLSTAYERHRGFCAAMREADIIVDETYPYQYNGIFTEGTGFDGAQYLLTLPDPPTALFICSSALTFGAMTYFTKEKIMIPQDLSFVCFGELINRNLLYVRPTLSSANLYGMGNKMAELLLERIQSETIIQNREVRFSNSFLAGNSIRSLL